MGRQGVAAVADPQAGLVPVNPCRHVPEVQRHTVVRRREADGCGRAAVGQHLDRLLGAFWDARGFKRELNPAVPPILGQRPHLGYGVAVRRIDRVGCAEAFGLFQLLVADIYRDDLPRMLKFCALDDRQADPAAADDGHP